MSDLKIKDISLYSLMVIIFGLFLSSTIIFISLNKIKSLNDQLLKITTAKNSFLEVKINTESILISKDLENTLLDWTKSIEIFDKHMNSLAPSQKKKFENFWYVSKKEISVIDDILNNQILKPHNLQQKPLLFLKGEMFSLKDQSEMFRVLDLLTKKVEFLFQYEKFILDEFREIDIHDKAYIDKQITMTIYYSVFIILFILVMTVFVIFVLNKKIVKIERTLMQTQNNLSVSLSDLNNSRKLLQNIIDTVPASIFWKDVENKYIGVNKSFLKDTNCESKDEILGKTDLDMPWKNSEAIKYMKDDNSVMESGVPRLQIEESQTNSEGDTMRVLSSKVPLHNNNDEIIGILGIYIDITEKEKIAEELSNKGKLLAQQSKMAAMGEMLENIAHQWRQPLSGILTNATGMKVKSDYEMLDKEDMDNGLTSIANTVDHLNRTIDDFRDYFKEDKEAKFFELESILKKSFSLVQSKLNNTLINIVEDVEGVEIFGFENEFIQVLMNIVNNSIDELEKSSLEKRLIFIKAKEVAVCGSNVAADVSNCKCVELKISDNAGGIPEDIIDNIFDAYFTTKANSNGTGIGLYMSTEMIQKHMKGYISVKNQTFTYEEVEYTGAEFTILIPAEDYTL